MTERCTYCNGNDGDTPCAYPSEGKPGCLRDKRLGNTIEVPRELFQGMIDALQNDTGNSQPRYDEIEIYSM